VPLVHNDPYAYRIALKGISINGHPMQGTHIFDVGVIDSGTTFTYIPERLFSILLDHFDWFCMLDPKNHCKGKRIHNNNSNLICFHYDEIQFPTGPKDYFMSYPILSFQVMTTSGGSDT
jgi:hypothetical protein